MYREEDLERHSIPVIFISEPLCKAARCRREYTCPKGGGQGKPQSSAYSAIEGNMLGSKVPLRRSSAHHKALHLGLSPRSTAIEQMLEGWDNLRTQRETASYVRKSAHMHAKCACCSKHMHVCFTAMKARFCIKAHVHSHACYAVDICILLEDGFRRGGREGDIHRLAVSRRS